MEGCGDTILGLDGVTITGADDLIRNLAGDKIGRTVDVDVLRFGKPRRMTLTAEERSRAERKG
jgi:S1-C subfamily serine protease